MPKWLKEIWKRLSSKSTIIGWILLLLGNLRHLSDLWDSWVSVWGKMNAVQPLLQVCTEYAKSPTLQVVLTVTGFAWIAFAAYHGTKKAELPTVSVPPPAAEPTAPSPSPQSSSTGKGPASQIMEQIRQIKSPLQQNEFAKTFTGKQIDWILLLANVHAYDNNAFTLILKETEIPSLGLFFLISLDVPSAGYDYLRFVEKDTKFRVTGRISRIDVTGSYIYVADASVTRVS